jgi:hypothetical protein
VVKAGFVDLGFSAIGDEVLRHPAALEQLVLSGSVSRIDELFCGWGLSKRLSVAHSFGNRTRCCPKLAPDRRCLCL